MRLLKIIRVLLGKNNNRTDGEDVNEIMKYLVVGLGNIGHEYEGTRHNVGFMVLDCIAQKLSVLFENCRFGSVCKCRVKNVELVLLKPSTYMNLSGNAVRYWLQKENIPI